MNWPPRCDSDSWCGCWQCVGETLGWAEDISRAIATLSTAQAHDEWIADWAPFLASAQQSHIQETLMLEAAE